MKKLFVICFLLLAIQSAYSSPNHLTSGIDSSEIPKTKRTVLEKYLTSKQAYELLEQDESILFIDVRDSLEVGISGHPVHIDAIVPIKIQTTKFDGELGQYKMMDNPSFLNEMDDVLNLNDVNRSAMIIITCGSGVRSAQAVQLLATNGYSDVWHIPDGYKGDEKAGMNKHNAWKLAGLPWSEELVHGSEWRLLIQ